MNAIQYALQVIRREIPSFILDRTFAPYSYNSAANQYGNVNSNESVDSVLAREVIRNWVNVDCNLYGGVEVVVNLGECERQMIDPNTSVFVIPFDKLNGSRIVSVKSLNYLNYPNTSMNTQTTSGSPSVNMGAMQDLYNTIRPLPVVATAHCQVIGDNVVVVRDTVSFISSNMGLIVNVENDENMNNLNPGAYRVYAELASLATKAYIYKELDITLARGYIHSGQELGRIREIVDGYSDALTMYNEYRNEHWGKTAFTNDRVKMNSFVKSMMSRGR